MLGDFYRQFRRNREQDPSGHKTVAGILANRSWDKLDSDFRAWVMELAGSY